MVKWCIVVSTATMHVLTLSVTRAMPKPAPNGSTRIPGYRVPMMASPEGVQEMARPSKTTYANGNEKFRALAAIHLNTIANGVRKLNQLAGQAGVIFSDAEAEAVRNNLDSACRAVEHHYSTGRDNTAPGAKVGKATDFFAGVAAPEIPATAGGSSAEPAKGKSTKK